MDWKDRIEKERMTTANLVAEHMKAEGKEKSADMLTNDIFDLAIMLREGFEDLGVVTFFEVKSDHEDGSYGTNYNRVNAMLTVTLSFKDFTTLAIGHKLSALTDSDAFEDFVNEVKATFMERYIPDEVYGSGLDYGTIDDGSDEDTDDKAESNVMPDGSTYTIVDD